jgi:hypothetical protein
VGAFTLPIGLTGNLFDLWGIIRTVPADIPLGPPPEQIVEPRGENVEDTPEPGAGTRGAEQ